MTQALITFADVGNRYPGGKDALLGASFSVGEGEFVYLTGHSSAGKSTAFRLIAALERPTRGTVLVNQQNKVGLRDREKAHPIALSGGEQQRVCIARAVVNRPSLLLADEPTASLDADAAQEILALFRSFHQVGVTVMLATHDERLIESVPARRIALAHGRVTLSAASGAPVGR